MSILMFTWWKGLRQLNALNRFVWLRPHWSSDKDKAISDIDFHRSSEEIRNYNDLTTQSKTDFRYLLTRHDGDQKITKTGLFRTSESLSESDLKTRIGQSGYTNHSGDINKGRRGDYLYLVWAYD